MSVITTSEELLSFCKALAHEKFITVDTEFLREKTYYPKLCLVQVSGPNKDARAIDPLADGIDLSPLHDLLQNPMVLKVFHSGRQDLEIFYNLTGHVVTPFFDTQIAAMVCGYGDSIGYENLVRHITGGSIDKSSQYTDWSLRPLSDKQVSYALGDVTHLCDVYLHLKEELEKRGRTDWVAQEKAVLSSPETYANDPSKAWERVKIRSPKSRALAILRELAAWREQQAQKRNLPKTWIMKDDTLADIAGQAPKNAKQLAKIRNLSKDTAEGHVGRQILRIIADVLDTPPDTWPSVPKKKQISQTTAAMIDILKMLLKIQAAEHEVAPKIIACAHDLEAIALSDNADTPALNGWRKEIFGDDAVALKNGRLAIGMKGGKITKFHIDA